MYRLELGLVTIESVSSEFEIEKTSIKQSDLGLFIQYSCTYSIYFSKCKQIKIFSDLERTNQEQ